MRIVIGLISGGLNENAHDDTAFPARGVFHLVFFFFRKIGKGV